MPRVIDAKLLGVKQRILAEGKLQKLSLLISVGKLRILKLVSFNDSRKDNGRNSAVDKVSLSPEFGDEGIIDISIELGLEWGDLLVGLGIELWFLLDFVMKMKFGGSQILIELRDELFVFDGVGIDVLLGVFEVEHSFKIDVKFVLIYY